VHGASDYQGVPTLRGIEEMTSRLTAESRAQLAWAPQHMRQAVDLLLTKPLDNVVADEAYKLFVPAFRAIWPAVLELFRHAGIANLALEMDRAGVRMAVRLRSYFVADPLVADAAEWSVRTLCSMGQALANEPEAEVVTALGQVERLGEAMHAPPVVALMFAQLLVMAIVEAAERDAPVEKAGNLALYAFNAASHGIGHYRRLGADIQPFVNEDRQERAARIERYAENVRTALDDGDWTTLRSAKMEKLR